MLRRWSIPLAGLALVAGSVALAVPAGAARHPASDALAGRMVRPAMHLIRPSAHGTRPMTAVGFGHTAANSTNWSGYAVHNGTYKSVSASWVEPTGHCSGNSGHKFSSFWVGLDGYTSRTVEQTGSEVDCVGKTPKYFSWYEMFPAFPVNFSNPVRPGDHFTGTVTFNGGSSYTLVLKDTTRHWSHTIHKSLKGAKRSSAEIIAEAPCCTSGGGILPLADFGTIHFTNATANGAAIGNKATKIVMVNGSGQAKDSVTGLTGGKNFSVTWKRST
jgi:hypothetical protein